MGEGEGGTFQSTKIFAENSGVLHVKWNENIVLFRDYSILSLTEISSISLAL